MVAFFVFLYIRLYHEKGVYAYFSHAMDKWSCIHTLGFVHIIYCTSVAKGGEKMPAGINLSGRMRRNECNNDHDNDCGEMHKFRVANAVLKIAIDVQTDFDCDNGDDEEDN